MPTLFLLVAILACGGPPSAPSASAVDEVSSAPPTTAVVMDIETTIPQTEESTPITPTETPEPTDTQPTLSANITNSAFQVVYTHESNLWLWTSNGDSIQLTDSYEAFAPKISSDGGLVVYLKGWDIFNAELWAVNIDGSNNRPLVSKGDLAAVPREAEALATMIGNFGWVPGEHTLAYNTIPLYEGPGSFHNNDLRLVDADTGTQTLLFEPGLGGRFTYSPDGNQIAIVTPESLSITNADGSNRRDILTFPAIYTYSEWNYYPQPVWAPDSGHLRVTVPPQDPLTNPLAPTLVWHIPADGSMPHMAGEFVAAPAYVSAPLVSPNTNKVIFLVPIGEAFDLFELWIHDLINGSQTTLYAGNISLHNWNPDSVRFVYSKDYDTEYFIGQMSTPPEIVGDVPVRKNLEWLTDEEYIFTSGEHEYWKLQLGTPGGVSVVIAQPFGELFTFDFYPKP